MVIPLQHSKKRDEIEDHSMQQLQEIAKLAENNIN